MLHDSWFKVLRDAIALFTGLSPTTHPGSPAAMLWESSGHMEGDVYVFWLLVSAEDPAYGQMNCQTCELVSLWDYSGPNHWLTQRENLAEPSQCPETREVTIIRDCLQDGHYIAVDGGNNGRTGIWTQAVWLYSLYHSQAHYLRPW